jgi:hypothetical protein
MPLKKVNTKEFTCFEQLVFFLWRAEGFPQVALGSPLYVKVSEAFMIQRGMFLLSVIILCFGNQ